MEENLNFGLEQEPAEISAAPKKRGKLIALIAGAVILCAVLIGSVVFAALSAKSPFEKTVHAVFPSTELYGDLLTKGGTLTIDGELADDLLGEGLQDPFCFSADYAFSFDGTLVTLTAGAKDDRVDLSFLQDEKGVQVYSDRLLGDQTYGILFDGLMDAIDDSPFAPDSKTSYALPRDVYDMIKEYAELLEEEPQTYEQTMLVYAKATEAMLAKADTYEKNETVSLVGGDAKAKVYSYAFGEDALNAFIDVLTNEWENNVEFRNEIESTDSDGQITTFIEKVFNELKMRDETFFEGIEITWKYAVKGGYLVYADTLLSQTTDDDTETINFVLRFTKKPKKDPSYDAEFSVTEGGETASRYLLTYRSSDGGKKEEWIAYNELAKEYITATANYGKNDAFALTVKQEAEVSGDKELEKLWQLRAEGTLVKTDSLFDLTVEDLTLQNDGETQFEMGDSSFRICIESGKPSVNRRKDSTDILSMSVAQLNELGAKVEASLVNALDSIGSKLEVSLVRDTYLPNALATVKAESHMCDYAYDSSNGHLFFAYDCGTSGEIWMYNASTMELIDKLILDDPVLAIDADGGNLVFVYETTGQQIAYVHSSADMTYIKEFDYTNWDDYYLNMQYPGDILVDGNRLIYISGDQFVDLRFTDIDSGETVSYEFNIYEGMLSIDRKNHVVAVLENNLSACDLLFYSTKSCDLIERVDRFDLNAQYLKGSAHFDGKYFWATANEWYAPAGGFGSLESALDFNTRGELAMVVYRDENLIATLETDITGMAYTAFYRADGTYCDSTDELYTWMQPIDGNHYLVAYNDGIKTVFAYCELVEGKTIG